LVTGADRNATRTPMEAAEVMNRYFVDKVDDLCKKALLPQADAPDVSEEVPDILEEVPDVTGEVPYNPQDDGHIRQEVGNVPQEVSDVHHALKFFFKFANAKRISKTITEWRSWPDQFHTSSTGAWPRAVYQQTSRLGGSTRSTKGKGSRGKTLLWCGRRGATWRRWSGS
jgi:hypothetical protein